MFRRLALAACLALSLLLTACATQIPGGDARETPPPTPAVAILRVNGSLTAGPRLRVTLPSIRLGGDAASQDVQLLLALADRDGTYAYALYPANRAGEAASQFDLAQAPLEISLADDSRVVKLWILALHNRRYAAAEAYGVEALAARLALGFRGWIADGDSDDDPLAAVVSRSNGMLFEWFAGVDVAGQDVVTLQAADGWNVGLGSTHSDDGALNIVYTVQHLGTTTARAATTATAEPTPEPTPTATVRPQPGELLVDETFTGGASTHAWYEGEQRTYVNRIVDGAYEIRLTDIGQREFALSWGSLEGVTFQNYRVEAEVSLVDADAAAARYGIWYNYQDDFNFMYFGVSAEGEYRAALILRNANRLEFQDWTPHPAVRRAAPNTLSIDTRANGDVALSINGTSVLTFNDRTFTGGSVAFFCYAESVPTTCRLESLRVISLPD